MRYVRNARDRIALLENTTINVLRRMLLIFGQIVRGGKRKYAFIAVRKKQEFQHAAALVVKKIFVPALFHQLGNNNDDAALRVFR